MQAQDSSHGAGGKSSRRLLIITVIMVGFAVLTWGVALFSDRSTAVSATSFNRTDIFIPAWLTLTIATVIISMWFARFIMTAEKYRDSETSPAAPSHSH